MTHLPQPDIIFGKTINLISIYLSVPFTVLS